MAIASGGQSLEIEASSALPVTDASMMSSVSRTTFESQDYDWSVITPDACLTVYDAAGSLGVQAGQVSS